MPWDTTDAALAVAVGGYWTRFAATGDPTVTVQRRGRNGTRSPMPTSSSAAYIELGDQVRAGAGLRAQACALYDEAVAMRAQQ